MKLENHLPSEGRPWWALINFDPKHVNELNGFAQGDAGCAALASAASQFHQLQSPGRSDHQLGEPKPQLLVTTTDLSH